MLQELLELLPHEPGTLALAVAVAGTIVGAGLCAVGARFSRPLVSLVLVVLGAALGMALPRWLDWSISGAGPAVGGAVLLGVSGWVLHRMWVGVGLGGVLSCWAVLALWIWMRNGHVLEWPEIGASTTLPSFLGELWHSLPPEVARLLPYTVATAMVSGLAAAILWDHPIVILTWSAVGTTLLAIMGIATIEYGRPSWIEAVDVRSWVQVLALLAVLGLSILVQWKVAPASGGPGSSVDGKKQGKKEPAEEMD